MLRRHQYALSKLSQNINYRVNHAVQVAHSDCSFLDACITRLKVRVRHSVYSVARLDGLPFCPKKVDLTSGLTLHPGCNQVKLVMIGTADTMIYMHFWRVVVPGHFVDKLEISVRPENGQCLSSCSVTRRQMGKLWNPYFDSFLSTNFSVHFGQQQWWKEDKGWL